MQLQDFIGADRKEKPRESMEGRSILSDKKQRVRNSSKSPSHSPHRERKRSKSKTGKFVKRIERLRRDLEVEGTALRIHLHKLDQAQ
jgi:hypothetical protein